MFPASCISIPSALNESRNVFALLANEFARNTGTSGRGVSEPSSLELYIVQIFIATPDKFGPMGLFGNITANIVYRMSTGTPFEYSPIGGASEWRNGPLTTRTDLSFEKVILQKNTARATLYIQVSNLFDPRSVLGTRYNLSIVQTWIQMVEY